MVLPVEAEPRSTSNTTTQDDNNRRSLPTLKLNHDITVVAVSPIQARSGSINGGGAAGS